MKNYLRKNRLCTVIGAFLTVQIIGAQPIYVHDTHIQTVQVLANLNFNAPPVINLGENEQIELSFDELSHEYHRYYYTLTHCNADWTPSGLSEIDYMDGFNENWIEDYEHSTNTTMLYTHYKLSLPNNDVQLKISGNYLITIYDSDNSDQKILEAGFYVLDKQVNVMTSISGDTDIDHNKTHQQVSFKVNYNGYTIRDPRQEIKVCVMQNNRTDNMITDLYPTYMSANQLEYTHNRDLIFDAGNEFRRFETVSNRHIGMGVESMQFFDPYYHITLLTDEPRTRNYSYDQDQNGRFLIRYENAFDSDDTEADYFFVHFNLYQETPFKQGKLYLHGRFTNNAFDRQTEMKYNPQTKCYECTMLLKQGSYNYEYLYIPNGSRQGQTGPTEGDFFETENEYQVLIYHRPFGSRYDQLIGMQQTSFQ